MKQSRAVKTAQAAGVFALGATIGSIFALLFAPASGRATRKKIGMRVKSLEHETVRKYKQTRRLLAQKAEDIREEALAKLGQTKGWLTERMTATNGKRPARRVATHHA